MITQADRENLRMLQDAIKENPEFGVSTDPKWSQDRELYESMLRLEQSGLVCRVLETEEYGIWWQATLGAEK